MRFCWVFACALVTVTKALADNDPTAVHRQYTIYKAAEHPRIDGRDDDAMWSSVTATHEFTQFQPEPGKPSRHHTDVKVAYDDQALYVLAKMYDTAKVSTVLTKRDDFGTADYFVIGLDPFYDQQNGVRFGVTAAGVQVDMRILPWCKDCIQYDGTWDAVWESAVSVVEDGWIAEMKIPYSALRFPNKTDQRWGVQFTRYVPRTSEIGTWNPAAPTVNGVTNQWGTLEGIKNIKPPLRLSLSPYVAAYYERNPVSTNPLKWNERTWLTGGMDLKYGITENFTLDMTLIPDFGQVQSDNVVLNLGPFETQYDEYRPFFTEGTELFNKGNLFYSRRVGGSPRLFYDVPYLLDEGEEIVTNPSQVQLLNATKISGRTGKGLGIGVFNAVAAPSYAEVRNTATGETREIETDVLTNYNIVVLDQTLKNSASVSFINANTLRQGSARDANVSAFRFNVRDKQNRFDFNGTGKLSHIDDPADSNATTGYAYSIGLSKVSGNFNFDLIHGLTEKHYDPNDLGIQFTNNAMKNFVGVSYHVYQPKGIYKSYALSLGNELEHRANPTTFLYYRMNLSGDVTFKNDWQSSLFVQLAPFETYDFYESRVGRSFMQPQFAYANFSLSTDARKPFRVLGNFEWAESTYPNDPFYGVSVEPRLRLGDRFVIAHNAYWSFDKSNPGYLFHTSVDSVFIGRRMIDRVINTFTTQYTFSPKATFTLRARHYWTKVTYNKTLFLEPDGSQTEIDFIDGYNTNFNAVNIDAVFTWQFAPGSFATLTWKSAIFYSDSDAAFDYFDNARHTWESPKSNQVSLKLIYYLDFVKVRGWFS